MFARLAGLTTFLLSAALLAAPRADAARPVVTEGTESSDSFVTDCGDFDLRDSWTLAWHGQIFLDDDGNPTRIAEHVAGTDTFYNPETGESITGTTSHHEVLDISNGTLTENGAIARITAPGLGVVYFDIGRFALDLDEGLTFLAGHHHALLDQDYTALCQLLG